MMKTISMGGFLRVGVVSILTVLAGCSGPGMSGGFHPGGGHDPGPGLENAEESIEPVRQPVRCEGRVLLRTTQNNLEFLPNFKVRAFNPAGQMISSAVTAIDGTYSLALDPNQPNIIRATHRGYSYEPEQITFQPRGPQNLPTIVATRRNFPIPGAGTFIPNPSGAGGESAGLTGTIVGQIRIAPGAPALDAVLFHDITVRDPQSNRILAVVQTDRNNRFRYDGNVGATVILEPRPKAGMRWHPSSQRVSISRGTREVAFSYDVVQISPQPQPRPRYPLIRPFATPVPGPRPWNN